MNKTNPFVTEALEGGAADLRGRITSGSVYGFVDRALGALDQRPIFKANVSSFSPLRTVEPRILTRTLLNVTEYFAEPTEVLGLDPECKEDSGESTEAKFTAMRDLRLFAANSLVVPVDRDYMYQAAMESTGCRLTPSGQHYWQLVKKKKFRSGVSFFEGSRRAASIVSRTIPRPMSSVTSTSFAALTATDSAAPSWWPVTSR